MPYADVYPIVRRFLKFQPNPYRGALAGLVEEEPPMDEEEPVVVAPVVEETLERSMSLDDQRLRTVAAALRATGAKRVLDLGCGE